MGSVDAEVTTVLHEMQTGTDPLQNPHGKAIQSFALDRTPASHGKARTQPAFMTTSQHLWICTLHEIIYFQLLHIIYTTLVANYYQLPI